ncbi:DUF3077 domain-containing protein [Hydrocarboniphaga effusa]|uniref:DUF3077 domain-containing protein n=1 Tax=Hydrocarboniphaga effusa TaxID=243629 RepID=UPI003BA93AB3
MPAKSKVETTATTTVTGFHRCRDQILFSVNAGIPSDAALGAANVLLSVAIGVCKSISGLSDEATKDIDIRDITWAVSFLLEGVDAVVQSVEVGA